MSPEAKSIVYGGGGSVAVLGVATLAMIVWMFLSALPGTNPGRAVAQHNDQPALPLPDAGVGKPGPGAPDSVNADPTRSR